MIPYVTPTDLLGNPSPPPSVAGISDAATLGVNFQQISPQRLWDMCYVATEMVDEICGLELRAGSVYEELFGPGHRLAMIGGGNARFITSRKPIISVVSGRRSYGGPPFNWQPIPPDNLIPEETPFSNPGTAAVNGATSGMAAVVIGAGYVGYGAGRMGMRVGLTYLAGWPIAGLTPSVVTTGDLTSGSTTIGSVDTTGVAPGAPLSAPGLPAGTVVESIGTSTLTVSQAATTTASGVTLTIGYPPGVTALELDDVTAWGLGIRGTIHDGTFSESVSAIAASTTAGPGTITLAAPTVNPHLPAVTISAMPATIRWATMLGVKIQALERGAVAVTAQGTPGRSTSAGASAAANTRRAMEALLMVFRREF